MRRRWYILLAVVFALHNAEEALAAHRLVELMQTRSPALLRDLYAGVDAQGLRTGLVILTIAGLVVSAAASSRPHAPAAAYAMIVFAAVLVINVFGHLALSLFFGAIMPGLLSAVLLMGPMSAAVLVRAVRESWIPPAARWTVVPAALLVHGPLLAAFIRAQS